MIVLSVFLLLHCVKASFLIEVDMINSGVDKLYHTVQTPDDGYIAAGVYYYSNYPNIALAKFKSNGDFDWSKRYGGDGSGGYDIDLVSGGGYILSGYAETTGPGSGCIILSRFNDDGSHVWTRGMSGGGSGRGDAVIEVSDGGFAVAGYTTDWGYGVFLAKFDSEGNLTFSTAVAGGVTEWGSSLTETSDGNFLVAGQVFTGTGYFATIYKFGSDGSFSWGRRIGETTFSDKGLNAFESLDGKYVLTGYTRNAADKMQDFICRFETNGDNEWCKVTGVVGVDEYISESGDSADAIQLLNGDIVIVGDANVGGMLKAKVTKYNSDGLYNWSRIYDPYIGHAKGRGITENSDGKFIICGYGLVNTAFLSLLEADGTGCLWEEATPVTANWFPTIQLYFPTVSDASSMEIENLTPSFYDTSYDTTYLCDDSLCEEGTNCIEGTCVSDELCLCNSGYYGEVCDDMTTCADWDTADPLATGGIPILMETSMIQSNNIIINFESPVVTERYDYRLKIGDVEDNVCDSWTGPDNGWTQSVDECSMKHDGTLSWDDVENLCSWDSSSSTDDLYIYQNTIYFSVMEDFDVIDRSLEFDYDIEVQIPRTVIVDTVEINVLSPVTLQAVLSSQDVSPKTSNGEFKLFTRVDYPYILSFDSIQGEPTNITSNMALTTETCLDESGDCDQEWTNSFTIDNPAKCDVSGTYEYRFLLNCRDGYLDCPYEDAIVDISTTIVSENFCDELQFQTDISATLESCEDASCTTPEGGFISTETAYFEVTVVSNELTLYESDIQSVWLSGEASVNLFLEGTNTGDGDTANFGKTAGTAPRFQFDLGELSVGIYTVNAKVAVTYEFETTRRRTVVEEKVYKLNVQKEMAVEAEDDGETDDVSDDSAIGRCCFFGFVFFFFNLF